MEKPLRRMGELSEAEKTQIVNRACVQKENQAEIARAYSVTRSTVAALVFNHRRATMGAHGSINRALMMGDAPVTIRKFSWEANAKSV